MRRILFLLIPVFISCARTTGNKLKSNIENRWKSNGVERLEIDSFRFELSDLREYYNYRIGIERDFINSESEMLVNLKGLNSSSPIESVDLYSEIVNIIHNISISNDKIKFINQLYNSRADTQQVYNVDYYIDYQTSKSNHHGHETDYLYAKHLTPVYINIDSLYALSNPHMDFDSVAYMRALKVNDSLESSAKSLQREMELRIASGIPPETELDYRLRISKTNLAIVKNKANYPFLF